MSKEEIKDTVKPYLGALFDLAIDSLLLWWLWGVVMVELVPGVRPMEFWMAVAVVLAISTLLRERG